MPHVSARTAAAALLLATAALTAPLAAGAASTGGDGVREKIFRAYASVKSYKVTVLGSVRSIGVWMAPNRYQMTTEFEGKPIKTLIVGKDYWTLSGGKWEKSGTAGNNLDVDIAGLLRTAKADPKVPFVTLPDRTQDGKRVGAFMYTFKDGTEETCDYDPATYLVSRCKADEITLLYSGYNDPANRVANPS